MSYSTTHYVIDPDVVENDAVMANEDENVRWAGIDDTHCIIKRILASRTRHSLSW